jgi:hypothetical protein
LNAFAVVVFDLKIKEKPWNFIQLESRISPVLSPIQSIR